MRKELESKETTMVNGGDDLIFPHIGRVIKDEEWNEIIKVVDINKIAHLPVNIRIQ